MTLSKRIVDRYNAYRDAAFRWPEWKIRTGKLGNTEKVIDVDEQVITINEACDDEVTAAQAVAHLDLEHDKASVGRLSDEDQQAARWLAEVRVDGERSWGADDWSAGGART